MSLMQESKMESVAADGLTELLFLLLLVVRQLLYILRPIVRIGQSCPDS